MTDFKFELEDEVKDKVTGFEGVVVVRTQWLNGCNTYGVQSKKLHEGKPVERQHFDEPQLERIKTGIIPPPEEPVKKPGGPALAVPETNRF